MTSPAQPLPGEKPLFGIDEWINDQGSELHAAERRVLELECLIAYMHGRRPAELRDLLAEVAGDMPSDPSGVLAAELLAKYPAPPAHTKA
jgi:hypothetical protein